MIVSNIQTTATDDYCELRATLTCEAEWVFKGAPFELWYRFPAEYRHLLDASNGDPFLVACLGPAMVLGEPLHISAAVSPLLLENVAQIQTILTCWQSHLRRIEIDARVREHAQAAQSQQAVGAYFSMGVDSSYTLLKNVREHPADQESITHLIVIEGCDMYLWESARFPALLTRVNEVAAAFGKKVIHVTTNLRDFSDLLADWVGLYHGAALATVALALQPLFRSVRIAAAQTYLKLLPLGTHPLLDPLWGTETLGFCEDGLEADRLAKIRFIAGSESLVGNLRVCATDHVADVYNCGRCEKCVRTMIGLHIAGALERCATLHHTIELNLIDTFSYSNPALREQIAQLIAALGSTPLDEEIRAALQRGLERSAAAPMGAPATT